MAYRCRWHEVLNVQILPDRQPIRTPERATAPPMGQAGVFADGLRYLIDLPAPRCWPRFPSFRVDHNLTGTPLNEIVRGRFHTISCVCRGLNCLRISAKTGR